MAAKGQSSAEKFSRWGITASNLREHLEEMPHVAADLAEMDRLIAEAGLWRASRRPSGDRPGRSRPSSRSWRRTGRSSAPASGLTCRPGSDRRARAC